METILEDFKIYLFETGRVKKTIESYIGNTRQLLKWLDKKDIEVKSLDRMIMLKYLEYLQKKEYKATTYNTKINSIANFNNYLKDKGIVEKEIVFSKDKIQLSENRIVDVYRKDEIKLIEAYIDNGELSQRDSLLLRVLKELGIRVSEAVDLKMEDIDIVGQQVEVQGKNNKRRILPMKTILAESIRKYISGDRKNNKYADNSSYLFLSERSPRIHRNTVLDVVKTMGNELGIEDSYCHKFRKTLASSMINRNPPVSIATVQKFLGHSDVKTTINHYTFIGEEQLRDAINNI